MSVGGTSVLLMSIALNSVEDMVSSSFASAAFAIVVGLSIVATGTVLVAGTVKCWLILGNYEWFKIQFSVMGLILSPILMVNHLYDLGCKCNFNPSFHILKNRS